MRMGQGRLSSTSTSWVKAAVDVEKSRQEGLLQVSKAKIVVYTALFGDVDRLWSVPPVVVPGARYVVFTEKARREVGLWTHSFSIGRPVLIAGTDDVASPCPFWEQRIVKVHHKGRKAARYYKTMAHKVLPGAEISIWVDANVRLLLLPSVALSRWVHKKDLTVFRHAQRNCLYDEVSACLQLRKGDKARITSQGRAYKKLRMPRRYGLATTRCLIRRHTPEMAHLNESWWKEIQKYSLRDQISLPFVCWSAKASWNMVPLNISENPDFWFLRHGAAIGAYDG